MKNEANKPNPALEPFNALIGVWNAVGTHPYLPDTTVHGRSTFEWFEKGAFLIMHSEIDEPGIPSGIAVFGSDDSTGEYFMLYFDERGISRKYDVSFKNRTMMWYRNNPDFSQRIEFTIADDGKTIVSKGEMSKNGNTWEPDLKLTLTRV